MDAKGTPHAMLTFLSWSEERSRLLAEELRAWLPLVIQAVEPWLSSKDIPKGARWGDDVTIRLGSANFGIVCVTPENREKPWLLFEAGALSKTRDTHVCTLLLDLKYADVKPPLSQFQHTQATEEDVFELIKTANAQVHAAGLRALSDETLKASFNAHWPRLAAKITQLQKMPAAAGPAPRSERELLEEILEIVRRRELEGFDLAFQLNILDAALNPTTSGPRRRPWNDKRAFADVNLYQRALLKYLTALETTPPATDASTGSSENQTDDEDTNKE